MQPVGMSPVEFGFVTICGTIGTTTLAVLTFASARGIQRTGVAEYRRFRRTISRDANPFEVAVAIVCNYLLCLGMLVLTAYQLFRLWQRYALGPPL